MHPTSCAMFHRHCTLLILIFPPRHGRPQLDFCFAHMPFGETRVSYTSACRPIPPLPSHPVHLSRASTDLHGL